MSENKFVFHNDSVKLVHGVNGKRLRVSGEWLEDTIIGAKDLKHTKNVFALMRSLPGRPLIDGINMDVNSGGMIPDSHQFLPMDMLESGWLSMFGVKNDEGIARTKLLISDEGGTGKTLSTCLAIRYISLLKSIDGPIICLVPPLLIDHWVNHLRAVFHDEPERIEGLSSAQHYNDFHHNRIVVVSKWSWSKHFKAIETNLKTPMCVVIDEVHQGRTGAVEDGEDVLGDEKVAGIAGIEENTKRLSEEETKAICTNLRTAIRKTCRNSAYTIGVSATPINLELSELNSILVDMGREEYSSETIYKQAKEYTKLVGQLMIETSKCGAIARNDFFKPILDKFPEEIWKSHGVTEEEISLIKEWCSSNDKISASQASRALRELHPYGRNLSIILRDYLNKEHAGNFRERITQVLEVESGDLQNVVWKNVVKVVDHQESPVMPDDIDSLKQHALILHSHKSGLWRINPDSKERDKRYYKSAEFTHLNISRDDIHAVQDERVHKLLEKFNAEIEEEDVKEKREHQIGAVIFCEWNGTLDLDGLPKDIKNLTKGKYPGKFIVDTFKGGQGLDSLKSITKKCRRLSLTKGKFPILIASPAGEVGIEMAWASNLVHWDIHTNPQRMEQRTWRVDRRMVAGKGVKPSYHVIFPRFKDCKINILQDQKIQPRWDTACNELGKEISDYIDNKTDIVSGIEHSIELLGPRILEFSEYVEQYRKQDNNQGKYFQQRQRWKALLGLSTLGFDVGINNVLDQGIFEIDWPGNYEIHEGNNPIIRDIELVSDSLAANLSLGPTDSLGSRKHSVHLTRNEDSKSMPLFDKLITNISPDIAIEEPFVYTGTKIEALSLSRPILDLHETERIVETGLIFKIENQWKQWNDFNNEEQDEIGKDLLKILEQCQGGILTKGENMSIKDKIDNPNLQNRLVILSQFKKQEEHKIECHKSRIKDEDCDEDERQWRKESIKLCKDRISNCDRKIQSFKDANNEPKYTVILYRK